MQLAAKEFEAVVENKQFTPMSSLSEAKKAKRSAVHGRRVKGTGTEARPTVLAPSALSNVSSNLFDRLNLDRNTGQQNDDDNQSESSESSEDSELDYSSSSSESSNSSHSTEDEESDEDEEDRFYNNVEDEDDEDDNAKDDKTKLDAHSTKHGHNKVEPKKAQKQQKQRKVQQAKQKQVSPSQEQQQQQQPKQTRNRQQLQQSAVNGSFQSHNHNGNGELFHAKGSEDDKEVRQPGGTVVRVWVGTEI